MKKIILGFIILLNFSCQNDDDDNDARDDGFTEIEIDNIEEFVQETWLLESVTSLNGEIDLNNDGVSSVDLLPQMSSCEIDDLIVINGASYNIFGATEKCSTDENSEVSFGEVIYGDKSIQLIIDENQDYGYFDRFVWNDIIELNNPEEDFKKYIQITRFVGFDIFENLGAIQFIYSTSDRSVQ